jgi:uncharacterized membrane protein
VYNEKSTGGTDEGKKMNQQEINEMEWKNPDNWSSRSWVSFYFCKKDSRTWVPKKIPSLGWTLNLATAAGAGWLFGFLVGLPLFFILIMILVLANS